MNKNVVRIGLLVGMMMSGVAFGNNDEKALAEFEKQVYSSTGYVSAFKNMLRLNDHAEEIAKTLDTYAFNNLGITTYSPLRPRKKALEPFFSGNQNNQVKALADACKAKIRNTILAAMVVLGGSIGYYFYSKNK